MSTGMDFIATGPLFDGRLQRDVGAGIDEAERKVAEAGVTIVREELAAVVKQNTGHYSGEIQVERAIADYAVTDGGAVYGPWLAGTSDRNHSTRFKGYAHWRRARQRLQQQAARIATPIIMRRIGGGG